MLTVNILCVGKLRERFYADACAEYQKRLTGRARVNVVEVPDEKAPPTLSAREEDQVRAAEGARLLAKIRPSDYVIALEIGGRRMGSEAFAAFLERTAASGKSTIDFVIGGSLGLSPEVSRRADVSLSFSDFTFCHQLMRVILLEQVYRAFKILANEPYHK